MTIRIETDTSAGRPEGLQVRARAFVDGQEDPVGRLIAVRVGLVTLEWFHPDRPSGDRWLDVRGVEWSVSRADVAEPFRRRGVATKLYEALASELRRRGATFFSSDSIRSVQSESFWNKQSRKRQHQVIFFGDRYVMNLKAMPERIDLGTFGGLGRP